MRTKLAIGVVAAKSPATLHGTLSNWDPDICRIYVHVDAKFDISQFAFVESFPHAKLVASRTAVFWGGFSMVEAEFSVMRAAARDGFEYIVMQSDDAVPLMATGRMLDVLRDAGRWMPIGATTAEDIRSRYDNFYCLDAEVSHPLIHKWHFEASDLDRFSHLASLQRSGKFPLADLFWSSQWRALPFADVAYLLGEFERDGHLKDSFRFSMIPDEHYVPTLLGRRREGARAVDRFVWTDFTRHPRPYVFQTEEDLGPARESGYLFARKVHDPALATLQVERNREASRIPA